MRVRDVGRVRVLRRAGTGAGARVFVRVRVGGPGLKFPQTLPFCIPVRDEGRARVAHALLFALNPGSCHHNVIGGHTTRTNDAKTAL